MDCIDIQNKAIFEFLLNTPENEDIILNMLNSILFPDDKNQILKFGYNKFNVHRFFTTRGATGYPYPFVIRCEDSKNRKTYVEIHFLQLQYGIKNISFETLREFDFRLDSKRNDKIDYDVFFVGVLNFSIQNFNNYVERVEYENPISKNKIELIFLDLPKFNMGSFENYNCLNNWVYIFKHGITKSCNYTQETVFEKLTKTVFDNAFINEIEKEYSLFYSEKESFMQNMLSQYREADYKLHEEFIEKASQEAYINLVLFEKNISAYPYSGIKELDIDLSSIEDELSSIAFNCFRAWVSIAKEKYPDKDFIIVNEQKIVDTFKNALQSAIYILFTEKTFIGIGLSNMQNQINACIGLINARVSLYWHYQYIKCTENDYKAYVALDVIKGYFNDEIARKIEINSQFWKTLASNINLAEFKEKQSNDDIINNILEDISNLYLKKYSSVDKLNIIVDTDKYISDKQIKQIIKDNIAIFRKGEIMPAANE